MEPGKRLRKLIKFLNLSVGIIALSLLVMGAGIAVYALTDISRIVVNGAPEQYEVYKPKEEKKGFEELKAINPEVIGWLNIYGTKIDYPITQAKDNVKYLTTGPDLKYSMLGSIFLDFKNKPDFSDFCSILYGHNMTPRAMFGNVKDFEEKDYFEAHKYGDLYYDDTHYGVEIFAVFKEDGYSSFLKTRNPGEPEARQKYIDDIYEKAIQSRDIGVTTDDRLLLMYTCSNAVTNGRDLLAARITDNTFSNPYGETEGGRNPFFDIFEKVPFWVWIYAILAILLFIYFMIKRKEKKRMKNKGKMEPPEEKIEKRD